VIGINPEPFTLRELLHMHEGKARHDWQIASSHMALLANINRDPKKGRSLKPADFDPTHKAMRSSELPKAGVEVMKQAIIDGKASKVMKEHGAR
jgi:hypothetical protein